MHQCWVAHSLPCRLVTEGFNPAYGARPLRRAIMRLIEDCLAERILTGEIKVSASIQPCMRRRMVVQIELFKTLLHHQPGQEQELLAKKRTAMRTNAW